MELTIRTTAELSATDLADARALCDAAWGAKGRRFRDESWKLALGGTHVLGRAHGRMVVHVSAVDRVLEIDGRPYSTGYVEAMATLPERWRQGLGTIGLEAINAVIDERYELGGLATGANRFYERLGWERWPGRLGVRRGARVDLTPWEKGDVMVRVPPGSTLQFERDSLLTCEPRPGHEDW